jgi:hypothetical protein
MENVEWCVTVRIFFPSIGGGDPHSGYGVVASGATRHSPNPARDDMFVGLDARIPSPIGATWL